MKSYRSVLFWILPIGVGALLRLLVIGYSPHTPIWDEQSFHELAARLAQGGSYGLPFWPPAWPYLLSLLYRAFGRPDHHLGLWFNLLTSVATLLVFGRLAAELFSRRVAVVALWIMALLPSYSIANALLIYEVWMQFLLIAVVLLAVQAPWSWPRVAGLALLCGLLTLIRPTWLPLPLVLWLMSRAFGAKPPLRRLLMVQLGTLVCVLPWIVYASMLSGRFVPIALQGGLHLWLANNPSATGTHLPPPNIFWDPQNEPLAQQAALEFIRQHPLHLITILPNKIWFMFYAEAWSSWFLKQTSPPVAPAAAAALTWASDLSYYLVLLLFLISVGLVVYRRKLRDLVGLILFGYGVLAQIALFTGQLKYRWPLQWIIIMYAAFALVVIAQGCASFLGARSLLRLRESHRGG